MMKAKPEAQAPVKQSTRMLKAVCPKDSGYTVRLTRKWIDTYGTPLCACHAQRMLEV